MRRYCAATPGEASGADKDEGKYSDKDSDKGEGSGGGEGSGETEKKAIPDNTTPVGNNADHMVSAVAGNGQVVARAVTARNLLQVCTPT